jgi:hypothetical protein
MNDRPVCLCLLHSALPRPLATKRLALCSGTNPPTDSDAEEGLPDVELKIVVPCRPTSLLCYSSHSTNHSRSDNKAHAFADSPDTCVVVVGVVCV